MSSVSQTLPCSNISTADEESGVRAQPRRFHIVLCSLLQALGLVQAFGLTGLIFYLGVTQSPADLEASATPGQIPIFSRLWWTASILVASPPLLSPILHAYINLADPSFVAVSRFSPPRDVVEISLVHRGVAHLIALVYLVPGNYRWRTHLAMPVVMLAWLTWNYERWSWRAWMMRSKGTELPPLTLKRVFWMPRASRKDLRVSERSRVCCARSVERFS